MKKLITEIEIGSIAGELGIEAGDFLVAINGQSVQDFFDFRMVQTDEELEIVIEKANGEEWILEIEKDEDEELGLIFESGLMDNMRRCGNKCVFCFIDQNAPNMRETLYVKDDDYRLSFLHGNYITLTNMTDDDVERILKYHISPVNISIHATDPNLRIKMMNNPKAGRSLDFLQKLADGGIALSLQIVLCKHYNDGEQLDKTIYDLSRYIPRGGGDCSLSVVPVGLTKYREERGLAELEPFNANDCREVIKKVKFWQDKLLSEKDARFVFAADEFYLKAGIDVPTYGEYEDFPQIENGVGMIAAMKHEFNNALLESTNENPLPQKITVVTGKAAVGFIQSLADAAMAQFPKLDINVVAIKNEFYGELITVVGLLTGQDIIAQLKGRSLGDLVLLPSVCLKNDEDVFLDDIALEEMSAVLNVPVKTINPLGHEFVRSLLCNQ
ncbi:MAG: DUF512 domain-containing protein [Defluviitaleaceae bacterium]|nr:DUF512 domain-containing protein [Defluviitaleaceae bacterium]